MSEKRELERIKHCLYQFMGYCGVRYSKDKNLGLSQEDMQAVEDYAELILTRPANLCALDEDTLGFEIYSWIRSDDRNREVAKEEWTARHFGSTTKSRAMRMAKIIVQKFGAPVDIKWPKLALHRHDSIICTTGEESSGCITCIRNITIKECMSAVKKARKG